MKNKNGKFINPNDVTISFHEKETIKVLEKFGYSGEIVAPTGVKGSHTPDLIIKGALWEMKSPTGKSNQTIERQFKRGSKQSRNLILDTRRTKISDEKIISYTSGRIKRSRSTRQVLIVNKKSQVILDFVKKI